MIEDLVSLFDLNQLNANAYHISSLCLSLSGVIWYLTSVSGLSGVSFWVCLVLFGMASVKYSTRGCGIADDFDQLCPAIAELDPDKLRLLKEIIGLIKYFVNENGPKLSFQKSTAKVAKTFVIN